MAMAVKRCLHFGGHVEKGRRKEQLSPPKSKHYDSFLPVFTMQRLHFLLGFRQSCNVITNDTPGEPDQMIGTSGVYVSWAPNANVKYNMIMDGARDFLLLAQTEMLARAYFCLVMFIIQEQVRCTDDVFRADIESASLLKNVDTAASSYDLNLSSLEFSHRSDNFCFITHASHRFYEIIPSCGLYLFCGNCQPVSFTQYCQLNQMLTFKTNSLKNTSYKFLMVHMKVNSVILKKDALWLPKVVDLLEKLKSRQFLSLLLEMLECFIFFPTSLSSRSAEKKQWLIITSFCYFKYQLLVFPD